MNTFRLYVVAAFALLLSCAAIKTALHNRDTHVAPTNYILDEQQRICVFHGVNISNFSKVSEGYQPWTDSTDYKQLATQGLNCVRFLTFWAAVEPTLGNYDEYYLRKVDEHLHKMTKDGVAVIVDLHQDLYCKRFTGEGAPEWAVRDDGIEFGGRREPWGATNLDPAVWRSWHNFWHNDTLQERYLKVVDKMFSLIDTIPGVLGVDVINEPFRDMSAAFERNRLTSFYYKIQANIQHKGYKKALFFEPWMSTSSGIPSALRFKAKTAAVYAPHYYDVFVEARKPYQLANRYAMQLAVDVKQQEANDFNSAMMFLEFGVPSDEYVPAVADFVQELDRHCAGWTVWSLDKMQFNEYGIKDTLGRDRAIMKVLVRPYPQRIAGREPHFNISDDTLRLTYKNVGIVAPTVIFIPPNKSVVEAYGTGEIQVQKQGVLVWNSKQPDQWVKLILK